MIQRTEDGHPTEFRGVFANVVEIEMLHVMGEARNELTRVDEEEPEEIGEMPGANAQGRLTVLRF